jgi:hypothetical protein
MTNPDQIDPHKAVDFILANAGKFAAAKADRVYLENFLRSKKAVLMGESSESAAVAREQYAYAHPDYQGLLLGIKEAVQIEETLLWQMRAAQARIEIFRTQEASNRNQDRAMR